MIEVVIIGSGNVAFHLHKAFLEANGISVKQLIGRSLDTFKDFNSSIPKALLKDILPEADVYVVCVSDSAVAEVFTALKKVNGLIVHTSGALDVKTEQPVQRSGVFYPLQTFSKSREVSLVNIPVLIEANLKQDFEVLQRLAQAIGANPVVSKPESRLAAHLAAVFVNNFSNHMVYQAQEICKQNNLDQNLLAPLLEETFLKLRDLSAFDAQTGPARRADKSTQDTHRRLMNPSDQLKLYNTISQSIENVYSKKL